MGHKTHPIGFRLGIIRDWQSRWFAGTSKSYAAQVLEDYHIRETIRKRYVDAGISLVEIERTSKDLTVNVHTARPGIVIGRGGTRVDELRKAVETAAGGKRVRLNVLEIRQPELDAFLVARSVADQLERRVMFRRATRQAVQRTMQAGALGVKVMISGRLGGAEIARREKVMEGRVPLHTLRADIDYGLAEARTSMGRIGVKVWIYRGDILPERKTEEEPLVPPPPAGTPPPAEAAAAPAAPAAEAPAEAPAAPAAEAPAEAPAAPAAAAPEAPQAAEPAAEAAPAVEAVATEPAVDEPPAPADAPAAETEEPAPKTTRARRTTAAVKPKAKATAKPKAAAKPRAKPRAKAKAEPAADASGEAAEEAEGADASA